MVLDDQALRFNTHHLVSSPFTTTLSQSLMCIHSHHLQHLRNLKNNFAWTAFFSLSFTRLSAYVTPLNILVWLFVNLLNLSVFLRPPIIHVLKTAYSCPNTILKAPWSIKIIFPALHSILLFNTNSALFAFFIFTYVQYWAWFLDCLLSHADITHLCLTGCAC